MLLCLGSYSASNRKIRVRFSSQIRHYSLYPGKVCYIDFWQVRWNPARTGCAAGKLHRAQRLAVAVIRTWRASSRERTSGQLHHRPRLEIVFFFCPQCPKSMLSCLSFKLIFCSRVGVFFRVGGLERGGTFAAQHTRKWAVQFWSQMFFFRTA